MVTNALRITYSFIWRKRQKYETLRVLGVIVIKPDRSGKGSGLISAKPNCGRLKACARRMGILLALCLTDWLWSGFWSVLSGLVDRRFTPRQASRSRRKPPLGQANFGREPLSYSPVARISRTPYRKSRIAGSSQISSRAKWAKCESRCVLLRCWPRIKTQNQRRSNRSNIKGRDRATIQSQPN